MVPSLYHKQQHEGKIFLVYKFILLEKEYQIPHFIQISALGPLNVIRSSQDVFFCLKIWGQLRTTLNKILKTKQNKHHTELSFVIYASYDFYAQNILFSKFSQIIFVINLTWLYFSIHKRSLDTADGITMAFLLIQSVWITARPFISGQLMSIRKD